MSQHALFEGLVVDEFDRPVEVRRVGGEVFYVVDDDGFMRHIESEQVDRQVLEHMRRMMEGHEEAISLSTMKMLGQEDIFTKAAIEASLKNIEAQFEALLQMGLPEEVRAYLGMVGFRVVVDIHGNVLRVEQPARADEGGEGE